jgi:hypothetical protein
LPEVLLVRVAAKMFASYSHVAATKPDSDADYAGSLIQRPVHLIEMLTE